MPEQDDFMLIKRLNGVMVADDFSAPEVDEELWHKWIQDTEIDIRHEDGTLVVGGTAGNAVAGGGDGFRFTGLVSTQVKSQNSVLIARLRVPKGIGDDDGMMRNIVHLCGSMPDYFMEVVYGKDTEGRTGWFQYRLCHEGFLFWEPPVLQDVPCDEYRDVKIEYSHDQKRARGFIRIDGEWVPTGPWEDLFMSTLKVELKINCPTDGAEMRSEFKDCRLYPQPSAAPVEFLVAQMPAPIYMCPDLRVILSEAATGRVIGEGVTDRWGLIKFTLPDDLDYPLSFRVQVFRGEECLVDTVNEAKGIQGLYPGDTWGLMLKEEATELL